jgi:PLP dependent protein
MTDTGPTYEVRLRESLPRVRERIAASLERAGRPPDSTAIVAVTKCHPVEAARAALSAGLRMLGENRVQELESKRATLGTAAEWHLIGHLQRNKVRKALALIDLLHSLDSLRLAHVVAAEAERAGLLVPVLVQVNVSGEATKGGFNADQIIETVGTACDLPTLRVRGLMTMAPWTEDEGILRQTFRRMRELSERCAREIPGFVPGHLSMGMSNDYEIAVEEGSTMVRLGTTLFGERVK